MKKLLCGAVLLVVASPVMANADYDALLKRYNDLHPVAEKVITLSTYIKNNAIGSFNEYNNGDVEALKNMHKLLNKLDGFGKELGEPLHNAPYSSCGSVSAMTGLYWDAVMSAKNGISDDKIENIDKSSIPYSWFQSHGILIQEGLYPRLAYLKAVDELYFKEDK